MSFLGRGCRWRPSSLVISATSGVSPLGALSCAGLREGVIRRDGLGRCRADEDHPPEAWGVRLAAMALALWACIEEGVVWASRCAGSDDEEVRMRARSTMPACIAESSSSPTCVSTEVGG